MGKVMRPVFGINFSLQRRDELVSECVIDMPAHESARLLVTANLDHVVHLTKVAAFREAYANAWRATVDGAPVFAYARFVGVPVPERVTGADLFPDIVARLDPARHRPFVVVANDDTRARLLERFSRLGFAPENVGAEVPPFGFENDRVYGEALCSRIRELDATHLFFGVGAPKSEIWIDTHRQDLPGLYAFCFGAGIDFYAGTAKRAPVLMQHFGFEWMWRVAMEPRRLFKRYFVNSWVYLYAIWIDLLSRGYALKGGSQS